MFGQLRHKFFTLHEGITASCASTLQQFTSAVTDTPEELKLSYQAGDEILEYWQIQWEAIHSAQDQNGNLASSCDRHISKIHQNNVKQFEKIKVLDGLISELPKINESISEIMGILGNLESLFGDVEISLLALEDTIDAIELQEKQLDQRFQAAMYQERRKAEFNDLSNRLHNEYVRKKSEHERKEMLINQEKQRASQERFEADLRQFKSTGKVQQISQVVREPEATLESVDLNDDDDVRGDHQNLEAFLSEDIDYDANQMFPEMKLPRQPSEDSNLTEKGSLVDNDLVENDVIDDDLIDNDIAEGAMSRTESIYYTPDATTDKLEQLSLQKE